MKKSKAVKNVMFVFTGQMLVILLGIIVPRIVITSYGSDVNGLLSTVTQIFTYMSLLEAGIGQAARNALYKPMVEKNKEGISYIASIARRYFRRITFFYGVGVVLLAFLMPFLIKSEVDYITKFLIIFFEGMSGVVSFFFIETQTIILSVDGREYINSGINVVNKTLSYVVKIIMASLGVNVAILQFSYFLITICKVIFYRSYFKKKYAWIDYTSAPVTEKLKDRNSYIITEVAWTLFSSTDMIVLSMFVSTQLSSVYSVYNMVFSNLSVLLNTVYLSVSYILGRTYHENRVKYMQVHDVFMSVFLGGMTILMSITYTLILPFIRLYTEGVTDVNYVYSSLPILFSLVQIFSWSRYVTGSLTGIAGFAKQVSRISLFEAITNLTLSVILVKKGGITGVLIATVVALPIKVIYCTYLCDKKILKRSYKNSVKILGINYILFGLVVLINHEITLNIGSYASFFKYGVIVTIICLLIEGGINLLINPNCINIIKGLK